jgi:hypothetical protein
VATNTTRLSTFAFGALVLATIAAFLVIQHLKVKTPLILGTPAPLPAAINPLRGVPCDGRNSGSTTISFYLDRTDDVDVYVVNANGDIVRTVATGRHMPRYVRNPYGVFHWDGRLSDGRVAPDGSYYFRVALRHRGAGQGQDDPAASGRGERVAAGDPVRLRGQGRDDPVCR